MPMKNSSTFIYFVKNFLSEPDSCFESMNCNSEKGLAGMDSMGFIPSDRSIQTILDFAHAYDVVDTESTGQIEMNYN